MEQAFNELERIANISTNLPNRDYFLKHSYLTGQIARELAEKLDLNPDESEIAGYFHDVGRCLTKDKQHHAFHEIIGARFFEEKGISYLDSLISQEQCNRIAQAFRSHFVVYEQFGMLEFEKWLPGLRDTNPELLIPHSWEEKIIIYADLTNKYGRVISFEERMADIKERDKAKNNPRLKAVEKAEQRLYQIKQEVEERIKFSLSL